jgi:hypothetical protein
VRDELLAGIGAAIDEAGGDFTMHYATMAVTAERRSPRDQTAVTADRL